MHSNKPMYRIYSRKRFNIFNSKKHKDKVIQRKMPYNSNNFYAIKAIKKNESNDKNSLTDYIKMEKINSIIIIIVKYLFF